MVDTVYKRGIPTLRRALERLREEFSAIEPRTDWTRLRIEPLLQHARALEGLLASARFSREFGRLRKGVVLFHSDLVYLRANVRELESLLRSEEKALSRRRA